MAARAWFFLQRFVALLLVIPLLDAFPDCHTLLEVWTTFRATPLIQKIGIVTIVILLAVVLIDVVIELSKSILLRYKQRA